MSKEQAAPGAQEQKSGSISGLPRPWSVAVQLIGTFGLAVFLVLYYVFVMEPRQSEALGELSAEVGRLREVIESDAVLVKAGPAETLAQLWIEAVVPALAVQLESGADRDAIERELKRETDRLVGFMRDNGRSVAEVVRIRMDNFDVAEMLTQAHAGEPTMSAADRRDMCRQILHGLFRDAASAK